MSEKNCTKEMERSIQRYQRRKKPWILRTQHLRRWTSTGTLQNPEKITNRFLLFLNATHWYVWRPLSNRWAPFLCFSSLFSPLPRTHLPLLHLCSSSGELDCEVATWGSATVTAVLDDGNLGWQESKGQGWKGNCSSRSFRFLRLV